MSCERRNAKATPRELGLALLLVVAIVASSCGKILPKPRTLRLNRSAAAPVTGDTSAVFAQAAIVSGGGIQAGINPSTGAQTLTVLSTIGEPASPNVQTGYGLAITSGISGVIAHE